MPFRGMADEYAAIARDLASQPDLSTTLAAISVKAVETIEGAEFAAITLGVSGQRYRTVGSTDELPLAVDQIQYDMSTYKTTQNQAFGRLRMASQHGHRKLHDIALDVVATGAMELQR
jgi:hypothetical protein